MNRESGGQGSSVSSVLTVTPNPAIDKTVQAPGFMPGSHVRVKVLRRTPAGKGINVARGIAALGGCAAACGLVGADERPVYASLLEQEHISDCLVAVNAETRTNTTVLDPEHSTTTHLREQGFYVSEDDILRLKEVVLRKLSSLSSAAAKPTVAFCGSLPPGFSPKALVSVLEAVRQEGGHIVVDGSGDALQEAVRSGLVDVVKPNLEELKQCLQREIEPGEAACAARKLLDRVEGILLTLGPRGAYYIAEEEIVGGRCRLARKEVVNTVGAGDAFLAGWLYARSRGFKAEKALKWAVSAGSASVTSRGPVEYESEGVRQMQDNYEQF